MKKLIIAGFIAASMIGCSVDTQEKETPTTTVEQKEVTVPNDSYVTLENNQSIGYKPNTDVTIVNVGAEGYYVYCAEGECPITVSETVDNSTNSTTDDHSIINEPIEDNNSTQE